MKLQRDLGVAICCLLLAAAPTAAQRVGSGRPLNQTPTRAAGPTFELPATASAVVVEYTVHHHMLANPDPEPLLRIYADGRVRIHHPAYMAQAGDYEARLSLRQLGELVEALAKDGVLDFDAEAVAAERGAVVAAERAAGVLHHVSDTSDTVIEIRLASYRASGAAITAPDFEKTVRWGNVHTDAQRFSSVDGIQGLERARQRLQEILDRNDLTRVDAAGGSAR